MKKVLRLLAISLSIVLLFTLTTFISMPTTAETVTTVIEDFSDCTAGGTVPSNMGVLYSTTLQIVSTPSSADNAISMTIGQLYSSLIVKNLSLPEGTTQIKFWAKGNTKNYGMSVKLRDDANGGGNNVKNVLLTATGSGGYLTIDLTSLTSAQILSIKSIILTAQNDSSGTIYFDEFTYTAPSQDSPNSIQNFRTCTVGGAIPSDIGSSYNASFQIVSSPSFENSSIAMTIGQLYSSMILKNLTVPEDATGIKFWAKGDTKSYNLSMKYRTGTDGSGTNVKVIAGAASSAGEEIVLGFTGLTDTQIASIHSLMITAQNDSSGVIYFDEFEWVVPESGEKVFPASLATVVKTLGSTMTSPITNSTYQLNFIDDFSGTTLNSTNWNVYTRNYNSSEESVNCAKNLVVENDMLTIMGLKETTLYTGSAESWETPVTSYFTGGPINSNGKKTFKYGRMEIMCKIPYSYGMWPAFWTMGTQRSWPWGGEIDIMEFVGGTDTWNNYRDDEYNCGLHWCDPTLPSNLAWSTNTGVTASSPDSLWNSTTSKLSTGGKFEIPNGPSLGAKLNDEWRVCGIEWTPTNMYFYCDGTVFHTIDITKTSMREAFHQNHYMILNLVMGGSWAGTPDSNSNSPTVWPQQFNIDWVKVWQQQ